MDLKFIKKIGKHSLMLNEETLAFVMKKEYEISSLPILEQLQTNLKLTHVPHIFNYQIEQDKIISYEEYIEGRSLRTILNECTYITTTNLNLYLSNLLNTLIELHEHQLLHKDIKPENIIINEHGAHLIDFDISREYSIDKENDTNLLGTKGYASPEQFGFAQTTTKSDIYSLGITIQEMLEVCILDPKEYSAYLAITEQMTNIDSEKRPSAAEILKLITKPSQSKQTKKVTSSKEQPIETKPKFELKHLTPFILTGKGVFGNLGANILVVYFCASVAFEAEYYNLVFKPFGAVICMLATLSIINSFVNLVTIPYFKQFRSTHNRFNNICMWCGLRLGEYLLANIIFSSIYQLVFLT